MNTIGSHGAGHNGASGYRRITVVLATSAALALALGACGGDSKDA